MQHTPCDACGRVELDTHLASGGRGRWVALAGLRRVAGSVRTLALSRVGGVA